MFLDFAKKYIYIFFIFLQVLILIPLKAFGLLILKKIYKNREKFSYFNWLEPIRQIFQSFEIIFRKKFQISIQIIFSNKKAWNETQSEGIFQNYLSFFVFPSLFFFFQRGGGGACNDLCLVFLSVYLPFLILRKNSILAFESFLAAKVAKFAAFPKFVPCPFHRPLFAEQNFILQHLNGW